MGNTTRKPVILLPFLYYDDQQIIYLVSHGREKKNTLSHLGQQLLAVVRPAGTGAAVLAPAVAPPRFHEQGRRISKVDTDTIVKHGY